MTDQPTEIDFNFDDLTLGDLEYLSDQFGEDVLSKLQQAESGDLSPKLLVHLVYRILLHDDPNATLDDARAVKVAAIGGVAEDVSEDAGKGDAPSDVELPAAASG